VFLHYVDHIERFGLLSYHLWNANLDGDHFAGSVNVHCEGHGKVSGYDPLNGGSHLNDVVMDPNGLVHLDMGAGIDRILS